MTVTSITFILHLYRGTFQMVTRAPYMLVDASSSIFSGLGVSVYPNHYRERPKDTSCYT